MNRLLTWLAQEPIKINPNDVGIPRVDDPSQAAADLLNATYMIAGIVCVIVIIVAGFMFMTASGDASLIKKAREMVIGAVIGLLVIILAFTITGFILGQFTAA